MGRQVPPGYIGRVETASRLKVSVSTLDAMVDRGVLVPHCFGRVLYFHESEVEAVVTARDGKTDIHEVKALALSALSTARRAEERMTAVFEQLGLNITPLQRDASSVRRLYHEAQEELVASDVRNPDWLRYWGGAFFGMDEVYLELVEHLMKDDEPWKVFHDFGSRVTRAAVADSEPAVYMANRFFQASRDHLRYVSYLHCRRSKGARIADRVFGGKTSAVDELYTIMH